MKRIKMSEILKDAGLKEEDTGSKLYEHVVCLNGVSYTVLTKNAKISLALSDMPRENGNRFKLIEAIYKKAKKFDGNIAIKGSQRELFLVNVIGENLLSMQ